MKRGALIQAALALLATALLAAGCPRTPPVQRPYPAPTAEDLLRVLSARQVAVRAMNARARATSWLGGERVRATVLMLVTRDGHLRLEAEVSLQGTVATLATDGERFALLDAQKNELSRGPACPANVASLVRIPLAPADVAAVLLGDVHVPASSAPATTVAWDATRGADVVELPTPGGALRVFFARHGADVDLVGAEALSAGQRMWQTSYEDFEPVGGTRLPTVIRFVQGTHSFDDGVEIRFKDRTLNVTPPAEAFTLTAPPGVSAKEVGCGS
jgi:Domain of unknown function (DUF4292)